MKKLLLLVAVMVTFAATGSSQIPKCQNDNKIDGFVSSQEAQGWRVSNVTFHQIYYFVAPTPPYINGTLQITLVPDCDPLEPCPEIAKLATFENWIQNNNGTCIWK